jgi:hypothetical protein
MLEGQAARDRQTEAGPAGAAGLVAPVEAVEDLVEAVGGYPRA